MTFFASWASVAVSVARSRGSVVARRLPSHRQTGISSLSTSKRLWGFPGMMGGRHGLGNAQNLSGATPIRRKDVGNIGYLPYLTSAKSSLPAARHPLIDQSVAAGSRLFVASGTFDG